MNAGAKLTGRKPRKEFHKYFGSFLSTPDFCFDSGLPMEDQSADNALTECTNYTTTDLKTDLTGKLYSVDWGFAQTLRLMNVQPTTDGADPLTAMQVSIAQGFLLKDDAPINAKSMGELFCANWKNWQNPADLARRALASTETDVNNALGAGSPFFSVLSAAYTAKRGVAVATQWYPEWESIGPDGILPMPKNIGQVPDGHMYAVKGKKTINGVGYWMVKSWQGSTYGDRGWCYMSEQVANAVLGVPGSVALVFAPSGSRWIPLVKIILMHLNSIPYLLPQLASTS